MVYGFAEGTSEQVESLPVLFRNVNSYEFSYRISKFAYFGDGFLITLILAYLGSLKGFLFS